MGRIQKLIYIRGVQIPGALSHGEIIFFTVVSFKDNCCSVLSLHTKVCMRSHASSRKRQIRLQVTGQPRTFCPQYGTSYQPSGVLNLDVASRFLEHLWIPHLHDHIYSQNYDTDYTHY